MSQKTISQLKEDDLMVFTLVYAAHEDLEMTQEEIDFITSRYGHEKFENMLELFTQNSDYENLEAIRNGVMHSENPSKTKDQILDQLTQLFVADGEYSKLEVVLFKFLEKILDSNGIKS